MASEIDPTVPADNVKVDKSLIRENFQTAADEITELQRKTSVAGQMAYNDSQFDSL